MTKKVQLLIGGAVIIAILVGVAYQSTTSTVYFYTPSEILADPGTFQKKTVRIGALVFPGSSSWNAENVQLSFRVTENNQEFIDVVYSGVKPDLFREGQGVVVEGRLDKSNVFQASRLLVKHNEEYQVDPSQRQDKEAQYRSLMNKE